jgi:dephospho-CoA kinase
MVAGLTGKYCAGKDCVARLLQSRGFFVIDVDALGHDALRSEAARITGAFGRSVIGRDGAVDRKSLGRIVFSDPRALATLESIVHPVMVRRVEDLIAGVTGDVVVNAAILHHMGLHRLCQAVVCVKAPFLLRLVRAMRRDGLPLRVAVSRILAQKGICPQSNDPLVDTYTVCNWGTARSLERRVSRLARRMVRIGLRVRG